MRTASIGGVVLLTLISACSSSGSNPGGGGTDDSTGIAKSTVTRTPASHVSSDSLNAAVNANNAMALDLYSHALGDLGPGNVLTSPISASLALTMAYAGAEGDTATQMAHALHIDPSIGRAIFDGQNALSQALDARGPSALAAAQTNAKANKDPAPSADQYDFSVVNSVWGEKTYTWEQPFLDTLARDYGTGVHQEDLVHAFDSARVEINAWVSDETKNKINDLLPSGALDEKTRMVLVNALHLKFPWETPFDPTATQAAVFTLGDGSTVSASFMNQVGSYAYTDDGQAQIAALPFANDELELVVALPHTDVDLASYEASLSANPAALAIPSSITSVQLSLPKVQFTSPSFSLTNALSAMGMKDAFDPNFADFSGMCAHTPDGRTLYIASVLQKAMIELDETGGEAAAATAVIITGTSVALTPVPMIVNRPYVIALVDKPTGAILMLGHIVDPTSSGSP